MAVTPLRTRPIMKTHVSARMRRRSNFSRSISFSRLSRRRLFLGSELCRLQMSQCVEHQVSEKQKRRKQDRESVGVRMRERVRRPAADSTAQRERLEQHIPTVKPQKAAYINPKPA